MNEKIQRAYEALTAELHAADSEISRENALSAFCARVLERESTDPLEHFAAMQGRGDAQPSTIPPPRRRKWSDPPSGAHWWVQHTIVDVSAIGALTALAILGLVPGVMAASPIAAIVLAYAAQKRRARSPRSPLIALLATGAGAFAGAVESGRDVCSKWLA